MKKITGAIGLNGIVYRAGQEKELTNAAREAGTDLSGFVGTHLEGDWGEEIDATDSAKALAKENGIDLSSVKGSGDGGRITKPDVQAVVDAQ